jgi:pimeloyl-ACP methyl ester carboxylesterase
VVNQFRYKSKEVFYSLEGQGPPVMLIHGFAEDARIWEGQTNHLKDKFQVISPDLPGSGHSKYNDRLLEVEAYADCLKALAEVQTLESFTVIGHSMGGYIALALQEKYPALVKGLGLFHSTAYADSEEKKKLRGKAIEFISAHGSKEFLGQAIPNLFSDSFKKEHPSVVESLVKRYENFDPTSLVSYYQAMMSRPDRTRVLAESLVPVLFVAGELDKAVTLEDSLRQMHLPSTSFIHILEKAAHMGMLEASQQTNQILESFALFAS